MTDLFDKILNRLDKKEQQKLTRWNIDTLKKFDEYNKRIHNKSTTRDCQIRIMSAFARDIGKTFRKMSKADVEGYFDRLTVKPYTIEHRRLVIVKFFKWFYDKDKTPKVVSGLKKDKDCYDKKIDPSDLWTDPLIKQLTEACDNTRDKAFIQVLYDSGSRSGEIRSMNVGDVHFEGDVCYINLPDSKTEPRRVGLLFSVPYLKAWLNDHPYKNEPKHPLWISFSDRSYGQRLRDSSTFDILKTIKKRAGIEKKINHHIMRHSRISIERRSGMKDVFIRKRHGLADGSMILERYSWLKEKDTYNDYRVSMGYEPLEPIKEDPEILKPIKCLCGAENPCDAKFCFKCRLPLNYEAVERDITILEMFKTNFTKFEGVDIDKMLGKYQKFKAEMSDIQKVLDCFNGSSVVKTEIIRKHLGLKDDDVIELLQYLTSADLIFIIDEKVHLVERAKFEQFITLQKRYLEVNQ